MSFIIGLVIGVLLTLFILGKSTMDKEQHAYMEGYLKGKSECDSNVLNS